MNMHDLSAGNASALPGASAPPANLPEPLEILFQRSCTLAGRVMAGNMEFIDAVDFAYSAACFAGTVDRCGDDAVQSVLAEAFMGVPRKCMNP